MQTQTSSLIENRLRSIWLLALAASHQGGVPYTSTLTNVHGVSIYLPFGEELFVGQVCETQTLDICAPTPSPECTKLRQYYTTIVLPHAYQLRCTQDTRWDKFVNRFLYVYYGCPQRGQGTSHIDGALPIPRPIRILNAIDQRAKAVPIHTFDLPLVFKNR